MKIASHALASHAGKVACACALLLLAKSQASAQTAGTIAYGIMQSTMNATPGTAVAGTVNNAYVTAVFGGSAYIQDSTGGIYFYRGGTTTGTGTGYYGLTSSNIGGTVSNLSGGSFSYYSAGTQFEYATASGATFTGTNSASGSAANIPASFYTLQTTAQLNSAASQGSASAPGIQNQLVTLQNVTITPTGTASATTFTAGGTYTMTDTNAGTAVLYVNAASGIVGAAVPVGLTNVSGVFQDYRGTSELLPVGAYDLFTGSDTAPTFVPEPSSYVLLGGGVLALVLVARRTRRSKLA